MTLSDRADRILGLIDNGLETPAIGHSGCADPFDARMCTRCEKQEKADESDFCGPCRAWILGDSPVDPKPKPRLADALDAVVINPDTAESDPTEPGTTPLPGAPPAWLPPTMWMSGFPVIVHAGVLWEQGELWEQVRDD